MNFFRTSDGPPQSADRPLDFYPLEDRVLLDGDAVEGIEDVEVAFDDDLLADWFGRSGGDSELAAEGSPSRESQKTLSELSDDQAEDSDGASEADGQASLSNAAARTELIFVDAGVDDAGSLLSGLRGNGDLATDWLIVYLDSESDGVEQITQTLQTLEGIDAVHILSHGDGTGVQLGNSRLDADSAFGYAGQIASWSDALGEGADLLIYGCDLASTADGRTLVDAIAELAQVDVAASDDDTGHDLLGGDWILEYATGEIETEIAFDDDIQATWFHVLNTVTFQQGDGNSYAGTQDTELDSGSPTTGEGADSTISIDLNDGSGEAQGLIRFDGIIGSDPGDIPQGVQITSATLTFETTDSSIGTISLHRMLQTWNESSTWDSMTGGISADDVEMVSVADSQVSSPTGTVTFSGLESTVQKWVDGYSNEGWGMLASGSDGWDFYTSEGTTQPLLSVTYITPGSQISTAHALTVDTANDVWDGDTTSIDALLADKGADGLISLREAIWAANNTTNVDASTPDTIDFSIGAVGSQQTIVLAEALPTLTDSVILDARTQGGGGYSGDPLIELDGSSTANFATAGINVWSDNTTVSGFIIHSFDDEGIEIDGNNPHGTGSGNTITHNWIGLNSAGAVAANADHGLIVIDGASNNLISNNVISGNTSNGILIRNADTTTIVGNFIGTNSSGTADLGNLGSGIFLTGAGASNNTIGGVVAGETNRIAFNDRDGVELAGDAGTGNSIRGNAIYLNTQRGIDFASDGVTLNDVDDTDTGPNELQNFPEISAAATDGSSIVISGTLNTTSGGTRILDFYASSSADSSGHGEAERYLGSANITMSSNTESFQVTFAVSVAAGEVITATATDENGNTSEFSAVEAAATAVAPEADADADVHSSEVQLLAPLSYHRFGESISTTAADLGSSANDGTYNGTTLGQSGAISGDSDTAVSFDGVDDYVEIAHHSDYLIDQGTVQLWFNADSLGSVQGLFSKDHSGYGTGGHFSVSLLASGQLEVRMQDTATDYYATSTEAVTAGQWYQLAVSFGSEGVNLFLDGRQVASNSYTGGWGTSSGGSGNAEPIAIGASTQISDPGTVTPLSQFFAGRIDEVAIFGSQLSESQIKDLRASGIQHYGIVESATLTTTAGDGVLANDWNYNSETLTATVVDGPSFASSFSFNADGSFSYTPNAGFSGTDSFTYQTNDGLLDSNVATVSIVVDGPNDAPVQTVPAAQTISEDTTLTFSTANGNAISVTDPDIGFGDFEVSLGVSSGNLTLGQTAGLTFSFGADGGASMSFRGSSADVNAALEGLTYTPIADFDGTDTLTVATDDLGNAGTGGAQSDSDTVNLTVTAVNDEQSLDTNTGLTLDEGAAATITASELATSDVDNTATELVYSIDAIPLRGTLKRSGVALAANDTFTQDDIDNNRLTYTHDDSETTSDSFDFTVDDGTGSVSTGTFTFTVTAVNDNSTTPMSDTDAVADAVLENSSAGTTVGVTAFADDADSADTITYSLDDDASGRFAIDANTGLVTVAGAIDREAAATYSITVRATSTDSSTTTASFTISVDDVDEFNVTAPSDTDATENAVDENAANGTTVGVAASATDADATTNTATYSMTDDAGGRFAVDVNTGVVIVADGTLLDRETAASHDITVRATSADGSMADSVFKIDLNDVDEFDVGSVTDADATANTIAEDATVGTSVGITASASDADATTNTVTYILDDDAGGLFAVDANTGVVSVDGTLDYETATSHSITVRGNSADGSFSTAAFTINITDVNESGVTAISDTDAAADEVLENSANGTVVGVTAFADDTDGTDTVSFSLDDDAGGRFAIDAGSGVVTVAGAIDREAAATYSITVRATSTDSSTTTTTFNIAVTPENDNDPLITSDGGGVNASLSVFENDIYATSVTATDADLPAETLAYSIAGGDDASQFSIDSNSGVLSFVTRPNFESPADVGADNVYDVIVQVSDGTRTDTQAIAVTVLDVADDGQFLDLFNADAYNNSDGTEAWANSWVESEGDGSFNGNIKIASDKLRIMADTVNDSIYRETDLSDAVTATVSFSYQNSLNAAQSVVLQVSGDGGGSYTTLTTFDTGTNPGSDKLAFDISSYAAANTRVRFVVATVGGSVENVGIDNFQIEYVPNAPPAITSDGGGALATVSLAENTTAVTTVTALDGDTPAQTLAYSIIGGLDSAMFTIDSSSGALAFLGAPDFESPADSNGDNIYDVIVEVSDGIESDTQTIGVTVTDVNEFSVTSPADLDLATDAVDENAADGTAVGMTASASDADATTDAVTYSLIDDAGGRFAVDANSGVVTVADGSLLDRESAASHNVTVRATSADGSTADSVFTININDVDEFDVTAPADSDATPNGVDENAANGTAVGLTASASDADATTNAVTYSLIDDAGGRFAVDANSGVITVADGSLLDRESAASHNITVRATSADGSTADSVFTVNINDLDEFDVTAPADSDAAANEVDENAANGTAVGLAASASDADATTDAVTYSLIDDAGGRFAVDANSGIVTVADGSLLDRESAASHNVTVRATSADGSIADSVFTINVNDLDEFDVTAPADTDAAANEVDENAANGTAVGLAASASDADGTTNTVTYSLVDDAGGRFAVDANSGIVTVADGSLLDRESAASHNVTVRATSADGSTADSVFTININDLDEFDVTAPADSDAAANEVDENAANGTAVGLAASASDADATTDAVTYSLTNDAGGRFAVDANSGIVTVADGSLLDRESAASHNVTVRATSADGSIADSVFTINVNDLDEFDVTAPNDTDAAANEVDENAGNGTTVGITASAFDADVTTSAVTYTLDDDAGGRFAIDNGTGIVTVADGSMLDFEAVISHNITVRATSADGSFTTTAFIIAVNDTNDNAPLIVNNQLGVVEGERVTLTLADLNATDAESTEFGVSVSGVSGGQFEHASAAGVAIENFTLSDVAAGEIEFVHDGNEDPPAYSVTVHDPDWSTGPEAASITFTPVNDAPIIVVPSTSVVYTENAVPQLIAPTAVLSDSDDAFLASLTVELLGFQADQDRLVLLSQTALTTQWNPATARFTFSGAATVAEYEAALHNLAYQNSSEDPSSIARTLQFTVSDGQLDSAVTGRPLQVIPINDAPVAVDDSFSTRAGELLHDPAPGVLSNDSDVDSDGLMTFLVSPPSFGTAVLSPNGELSYLPNPGFFGTDIIRYQISDGAAMSETAEIRVEVTAVGGGQAPSGGSQSPALPSSPDPGSQDDGGSSDSQQSESSQSEPESEEEQTSKQENSAAAAAAGVLPTPGQGLSPGWMQVVDVTQDGDGSQERNHATKMLGGSLKGGEAYREGAGGSDSGAGTGSRLEYELMQEMLRAEVRNSIVWTQWDQRREESMEGYDSNNYTIGAVGASAGMASVGYAMWAIRGGAFAATMFSSVPTWRLIDPAILLKAYRNQSPEDSKALQDLLR